MTDQEFPESYYCSITGELMKDPVQDPYGDSYERTAIENWLRDHRTSPINRKPLCVEQLTTNRAHA